MAAEFELTDEMRAVVGVESEPWPVEITTTSVRAFGQASCSCVRSSPRPRKIASTTKTTSGMMNLRLFMR